MDIINTLSPQRVNAYRQLPTDTNEQVLARYCWNIRLSESLYPVLHLLEVTFRNHIHDLLAQGTGRPEWLPQSYGLSHREVEQVQKAITSLSRQSKKVDPGTIIAELNFGFWTSLFDVRYERVFWQRFIKDAFPTMPRKIRTRHTISARLNKIRVLRNRVFHYEPIWHWQDLHHQHFQILETLKWMSPAAFDLISPYDRFQEIYTCFSESLLRAKNPPVS